MRKAAVSKEREVFAKRAYDLMVEQKKSMRSLANLAGLTDTAVCHACDASRDIKLTSAVAISKALGVSLDYLVGFTDQQKKEKK